MSKPVEQPAELISIEPVEGMIEVVLGTTEDVVKDLLAKTTTIKDSKDNIHTVNLNWTIENYNKDLEGNYNAIGRFTLPEGINNSNNLELKVETTVKVFATVEEPIFPEEVEDVFVGKSQVTKNTYANIKIKAEYVSLVESVYIDGELANKMEDDNSQWRIKVADGTTADELKGRIEVTGIVVDEEPQKPIVNAIKFGGFDDTIFYRYYVNLGHMDNFEKVNKVKMDWIDSENNSRSNDIFMDKDTGRGELGITNENPSKVTITLFNIFGVQIGEAYEELTVSMPVDNKALTKKITEVEGLNEKDYTAESWEALQIALEAAKVVASDDKATQEEVDQALVILTEAIEALEETPYVTSVIHTLVSGKDAYRLSEWGNFPEENKLGHHYKLRFKFKDGSSYENISPVKIRSIHRYTAKEAEEIKNFDVIVYEKGGQFGPYNELFTISDVAFEGPNQYDRDISTVRASIGDAEKQVNRIDFETMSENLEKAKIKLEEFLEKYPQSEDKAELDRRVQVIQTYVDAYNAVKKAEESKIQEDIDKAKELIDLIPADESQGLIGRFKAIAALRERLGEIIVENDLR